MSETDSFVDPVFLARFGLARHNVLDYFLHPLNPFRTKTNTSNEVLSMQGISIGMFMAQGIHNEGPMSPIAAEEEYNKALSRLTGEQYELLPPGQGPTEGAPPLTKEQLYLQPSPLYVLRHVVRTSSTHRTILGIYYIVEGVIYKSPSFRSVMKSNIARTAMEGLSSACNYLSKCARFTPETGYVWVFEENSNIDVRKLRKRKQQPSVIGERTAAEEEHIRASEAIDQILVRLSKKLRSATPTNAATTTSNGSVKNDAK